MLGREHDDAAEDRRGPHGKVEGKGKGEKRRRKGDGKSDVANEHVGSVVTQVLETVTVEGLHDVKPWTIVHFKGGIRGLVVDIKRNDTVSVALLDFKQMGQGARCVGRNERVKTPTGPSVVGRIIDPLGEALDADGDIPMPPKTVPVMERQSKDTKGCRFLPSGLKTIDAFYPLDNGCTTAILGGRGVGKSQVALDMIITQHRLNAERPEEEKMHCIYVAVGRSERSVGAITRLLRESGAIESTTLVTAPRNSTAARQFLAPYTGAEIAKSTRDSGRAAMIVYDDVCAHNEAARRVSIHSDGPAENSALFQQSAVLKNGGSLATIVLAAKPTPAPGEVNPDDIRLEAFVDQITPQCDKVIPLVPTGLSHRYAVPLALDDLGAHGASVMHPKALQKYMQRLQSLLLDLKSIVGDAFTAMQFDIEPEADLDMELQLYGKIMLLFAPTKTALNVAVDNEVHNMDVMAPRLAALASGVPDVSSTTHSSTKSKAPQSFNREALLREREEHRRKVAARRLAGVGEGADSEASRLATLNKRATPAQLLATLYAVTHGYINRVPLHQVLEFESRLWGTLATLPAPTSAHTADGRPMSLLDTVLDVCAEAVGGGRDSDLKAASLAEPVRAVPGPSCSREQAEVLRALDAAVDALSSTYIGAGQA